MSKYIGRLVDVGLGKEAVRGVGVTPTYWIPQQSFKFDDQAEVVVVDSGIGNLSDAYQTHITTKWGEGDIEGEVRDKSFGLFLYASLGSLSSSTAVDSAYTHSFSIAESNQHQSLSLVVIDPNTTEMYELTMVDKLELEQKTDELLKYTASLMGKQAQSTTATASYVAENKFTSKHFSLKRATALAGLTAATATSIKEFKIEINKNLEKDTVLGTATPEDFINKSFSVEGEFTLNYVDETWKNIFTGNTMSAFEFKWTNTDALIGTGTRPSLTIRMPNVAITKWEPDYSNEDIVSQTISFKGLLDVSGGNQMISTCALVNAVASY